MSDNVYYIYLVRHGESEANANDVNQGHLDSPLTKHGEKQAVEIAAVLSSINFTAIFSSDLKRARHTAEIISLHRDLLITTSEFLRERNFGTLEGLPKTDYKKIIADGLNQFKKLNPQQKWKYRIHLEIESDDEVFQRFNNYMQSIIREHTSGNILIVSHRGPIRLFLAKLGTVQHEDIETNNALQNTGYVKLACLNGLISIEENDQ